MATDMTVPCGEGYLNLRVGAIIQTGDRFLMVGNEDSPYLYTVGGRIQFGETAEQAVVREVREETGLELAIDRLGFVHENYFIGDSPSKLGKVIYELSFFFYMKTPEDLQLRCDSFTEDGFREHLTWATADDPRPMYPGFFRTELKKPGQEIRHLVTDERWLPGCKVTVKVDRPMGSAHPEWPDLIYPVNYGYVPGRMAPDGEEQDAYLLGVEEPVEEFTGRLAAVIHRLDDVEDKWVVTPLNLRLSEEEIREKTWFQERYFKSEIRMADA